MRKSDYSFLNNGLHPANLVNLTSNIAALKTMAGVRKDEYTKMSLTAHFAALLFQSLCRP